MISAQFLTFSNTDNIKSIKATSIEKQTINLLSSTLLP
ncbi:hypothetical protein MC7420_3019 [Coleofasciculus chthonoplastes PCC 7420]|uniref:Uncharacterized protein n=1 Tax=Coleofasciculus chthonoplastes PCC 7420 TaxID=118168 RepID=B4VJR9_9CYAN|nr:hypothetical protein MC7420_3019 [Coleofasciculus chthonoplastes PCC 7420]